MRGILILLCIFSAAVAGWLVAMENLLRHTGYAARTGTDLLLLIPAVLTLGALARPSRWLNFSAVLAGAALAIYGAYAIYRAGYILPHFEGYLALIALVLIVQGVLTALVLGAELGLGRRHRPAPGK